MQILNGFSAVLLGLPQVLVWLAGIAAAILLWRRHPRLSLLVAVTLAGLVVVDILGNIASANLPILLHSRFGMPIRQLSIAVSAVNLVNNLIHAAAWALILYAAFGWRREPAPVLPPANPD
jgi:hypothetical protein